MSTIVTRAGKGSILTNTEMDANFTNLNNDKIQVSTITGTSGKTTPVDADLVPIVDSTGTVLNKVTWANIKATLKTYFDTLYAKVGAVASTGITMSTARLLGRTTASTGAVEEITVGSGLSLSAGSITAPVATATVSGLVPTPPNNTTTFLRGDATFATLPSSGVSTDVGAGGVGMMGMMVLVSGTVASGATTAGSNLRDVYGNTGLAGIYVGTVAASGTWRNITGISLTSGVNDTGMFQRIS